MRKNDVWATLTVAVSLFACFGPVVPARAQDAAPAATSPADSADAAQFGEAAPAIAAMRGVKNKTVVLVFDVSGSMRAENMLRRARTAAIQILRNGTGAGDHVTLYTFGAGNDRPFDQTLTSRAEVSDLLSKVPAEVGTGAGTNIRKPHHEALKLVDKGLPSDGYIILLTDSFNDEPKPDDPAYPTYKKYYTPGGRLTRYPNTPENRDYERLLEQLLASGKLHQFGIGVQIAPNGRPIERLPQGAPPAVEAPEETPPPATGVSPVRPDKGNNLLPLWLGLAAVGIGVAVYAVKSMNATTALRITGGPSGSKDFAVKNGQSVRLGGEGATVAFDAYGLPAAKEPVAFIKGARGGLLISPAGASPATTVPAAVAPGNSSNGGNPASGSRVYHNGLVLERDTPLNYGDEVRVSIPVLADAAAKEYRLRFEDPRKAF